MKLKADGIELLQSSDGSIKLTLTVKDYNQKRHAQAEISNISNLNALSVEITPYREKRSLSQNGYAWKLIHEIASVIKSDKDSVYLRMLKRYGVYEQAIIKKEALDRFIKQWRYVEIQDEKQQQNVELVKVLCYYGSSTYDTKEMSDLLDGVISEAKEMGIETMTPDELQKMRSLEYEKERGIK